jgi:hypothetical protein
VTGPVSNQRAKETRQKCLQYLWYCCYITCLILVLGLVTALQVNIHVLYLLLALVLWDCDHTTTRAMCLRSESPTYESLYVIRHSRRAIRLENAIRCVLCVKQSVDLFHRFKYSHTDSIIITKTPPFPILETISHGQEPCSKTRARIWAARTLEFAGLNSALYRNICRLLVLCNQGNFTKGRSVRECRLLKFLHHSVTMGSCYQMPEWEKWVLLSKMAMDEV